MYIIGLLGGLRLYQTRHHDVVISGHLAYTSFALVIFTSVIGVVRMTVIFLIDVSVSTRIPCTSHHVVGHTVILS